MAKKPPAKAAKKLKFRQPRRMRLLPLTVTMLSLLLVIKANELYIGSRELRELYSVQEASAADDKSANATNTAATNTAATNTAATNTTAPSPAGAPDATNTVTPAADATANTTNTTAPAASGNSTNTTAPAANTTNTTDATPPKDDKSDDKKPEPPKTFGTGKSTVQQIEALKASQAQPRYTQTELDLLENLSKRRDELDQRDKELDIKSHVLDATEKRIDDKITEMKTMQAELAKVVAQYNEKQDTQIKSLVKIYENMKPGDAAVIFNELDMPILLEVIDKMSERKVAPVLAAMDPKKARDVTEELAAMRHKQAAKLGVTSAPGITP